MAVNEGLIKEDVRRIIISAPTAKELVLKLEVQSKLCYQFITNSELRESYFDTDQICDLQEYVPEYEVGFVWEDQMPPPHSFVPELEPGITSS